MAVRGPTFAEVWERFTDYARRVGATKKVEGAYAYRSPGYRQRTNRGRYVRLEGVTADKKELVVHDNKCGQARVVMPEKGGE